MSTEDLNVEPYREQLLTTSRLLWGEERTRELADQIEQRAVALARIDRVPLGPMDVDLDFLHNERVSDDDRAL